MWLSKPSVAEVLLLCRKFASALFINAWWKAVLGLTALVSLIGTYRRELPADKQQEWLVYNYLPDWPWYVWVLGFCVLVIVLTVVAFFRYFATKEIPLRQQYVVSRFFWSGRELQRKCSKRKRVWKDAQAWAIKANAAVSYTLGAGYGVRFKADHGIPRASVPQGVKDAQSWEYLENRLFRLHEITEELTRVERN